MSDEGALLKTELKNQLKQLFELQEERVLIWSEFDVKFKEYCLSAPQFDLNKLKLICKEISEKMNSISIRIVKIKNMFSSEVFNLENIYQLIDRLQATEQIKFKTVVFYLIINFFFCFLVFFFFYLKTLDLYVCEQERLEKLAHTDELEYVYRERISSFKKKYFYSILLNL
jgi:hypothetical protein